MLFSVNMTVWILVVLLTAYPILFAIIVAALVALIKSNYFRSGELVNNYWAGGVIINCLQYLHFMFLLAIIFVIELERLKEKGLSIAISYFVFSLLLTFLHTFRYFLWFVLLKLSCCKRENNAIANDTNLQAFQGEQQIEVPRLVNLDDFVGRLNIRNQMQPPRLPTNPLIEDPSISSLSSIQSSTTSEYYKIVTSEQTEKQVNLLQINILGVNHLI